MKKYLLFQTKIFIFLSCLSFIIPVAASAKQVTVSAYLDSKCDHHRGEIVVPQGFIATDFSAQIDSSWLPCAGPEPPSYIRYHICLFQGYEYGRAQYVSSVLARFDTGRKFNCRSKVQIQVDRGKGWETIKTIQAVSSSGD